MVMKCSVRPIFVSEVQAIDRDSCHIVGWEEYARSVHSFLTGLGAGIPVDFSKRNLVGVGHSMGGVAL